MSVLNMRARLWVAGLISLAVLAGIAGILFMNRGDRPSAEAGDAPPLSVTSSQGPIAVTLTAEPGAVTLDNDVLLRITISSPSEMDVRLPDLTDRLQGFTVSGQYDHDPEQKPGRILKETHVRLTPVISDRYRVSPMAITYLDRSTSPPREGWFPTEPLNLILKKPLAAEGASVSGDLSPRWIRPETKTILLWVAFALLGAVGLFLLWKLATRVKEEVALRRMSPKERALRELALLMRQDLIRQRKIKEFYFELTMIVRRYIERQHGVRAPEQTTEEFMAAVSQDARFSAEVINRLRAFLQAADLVKYAAFTPDDVAIGTATRTATEYIERDAASAQPAEGGT